MVILSIFFKQQHYGIWRDFLARMKLNDRIFLKITIFFALIFLILSIKNNV